MRSGCVYFTGDIPEHLSIGTLLTTDPPLQSSILERYTLGSLVSPGQWRDKRASMDMNRGPYSGPLKFIEAMAKSETQFIKAHAQPRMNYHRSSTGPEQSKEVLDLLKRYLQLTTSMVPPSGTIDTHSATLWHSDLHLDNVYVDPDTKKITHVIDWQSAATMPFFCQRGVPRMFKHPGRVSEGWALSEVPGNYNSLDQNEKIKVDSDRKSEACHKYYMADKKIKNPRHWAALQLDYVDVRTEPSRLVVNS